VSKVYFEGLNTYDEKAKVMRLGVNNETLRMYGAASAEVAHEMAAGLLARSQCNICVATTGVAGPLPEGKKPVGLCFIAAGIEDKIFVDRYEFAGDREKITKTAINYALFAVYKLLQ
jgi:nicotinamide-nucleotide amidase